MLRFWCDEAKHQETSFSAVWPSQDVLFNENPRNWGSERDRRRPTSVWVCYPECFNHFRDRKWWSKQKPSNSKIAFLLRVYQFFWTHYLLCSCFLIETRRPRLSSPPEWKASSLQLNGILLRRSEIPNGQQTKTAFSSTFARVPNRRDACSLAPQTRFMYSPLACCRTFMLLSFKVKMVIMDTAGGENKL